MLCLSISCNWKMQASGPLLHLPALTEHGTVAYLNEQMRTITANERFWRRWGDLSSRATEYRPKGTENPGLFTVSVAVLDPWCSPVQLLTLTCRLSERIWTTWHKISFSTSEWWRNRHWCQHLMSTLLPFSAHDVDVARAFWPVAMQQPWLMQAVALGGEEGDIAAGLWRHPWVYVCECSLHVYA